MGDLPCFSFQAYSQKDHIHLLKLLVLKGHNFTKEKLQFAKIQVWYLEKLVSKHGLHPNRLFDVLNFPKPKTKQQLWNFLGLVSYCKNWIPNVSFMANTLCVLLKNNNLNSIYRKNQMTLTSRAYMRAWWTYLLLEIPITTRFLFSFCIWKEKGWLWVLTQKHMDHH